MFDMLIKGDRVVTPAGVGKMDVAVQGEQIVAVAAAGTLPQEATRTLDANGRLVVPGGVEAHAHMGLYPRKGAIAPGSDADITFIDTSIHKKLSLDDMHLEDYSVWEGWEIQGWPVTTVLRGKVMVEDGKLLGGPNDGRLLPRNMATDVIARPAC